MKETKTSASKAKKKTATSKTATSTDGAAKNGTVKKKPVAAAKKKRPAAAKKTVARKTNSIAHPAPDYVAVAAYFKAQQRLHGGVEPDPIADWHEAEAELARGLAEPAEAVCS